MNRLAALGAIAGFFVMAFVGWASAVPLWLVSLRSLAGAVVLFVVFRLATKGIASIVASVAARRIEQENESEGFFGGQ